MNKSELVDAIADRSGVSKTDVDATLKGMFEVVAQTVSKGDGQDHDPGLHLLRAGATGLPARGGTPRPARPSRCAATNTVKVSAGAKLKAIAAGKEPPRA